MVDSGFVHQIFRGHLQGLAPQGLGLSVDVYSPDLFELIATLKEQALEPSYLEVFKASTSALNIVREVLPNISLAYHGEGVWVTQPDVQASPFFQQDVQEIIAQLNSIESLWLNHECAMKQMGGYSFGTYIPPLYTPVSAAVVAENIVLVQQILSQQGRRADGTVPLFLLEMPPLTYFVAGTVSIPHFFQLITARAPCGLVLDMGHIWTVYRYTAAYRQMSLDEFLKIFLDEFPLERVIEIHVAGLACHNAVGPFELDDGPLKWIDAHAAPIPSILFDMLEQVLVHPNLVSLKAVALEVDTKSIEMIVEEYAEAVRRFSVSIQQAMLRGASAEGSIRLAGFPQGAQEFIHQSDRQQLSAKYERYAQIISGHASMTGAEWQDVADDPIGLTWYRTLYLPHEILHWGGDLVEMFPQTCQIFAMREISLAEFIFFWFRSPRPVTQSYDFFLLKIERFLEFVAEVALDVLVCAKKEGALLRQAYAEANEVVIPPRGMEPPP